MKQTCNKCISKDCEIWNRHKDGKLRNAKQTHLAVIAEKTQNLICFVPPETKLWKFPDLVSKVDIINPNNN